MIAPLFVLLAAAAPPQEAPPAAEWPTLNRPEVAVNEDLLTRRRIERQLKKAGEEQAVSTREEKLRLQVEIVQTAVEELVLRQAGEDLGQPKEAVDRFLDNVWEEQMERSGGLHEFSLKLAADDESSIEQREELEGDVYRWTYTRVITGNEPGKDGRLIADRFVRPGERRRLYDSMERTGLGLGMIGGKPPTFVLQQLLLVVEEGGPSVADLRRQADELRQRAVAGEDFHTLVNTYGAQKGPNSISSDVTADTLARHGPELAAFGEKAVVGAISPVGPVRDPLRGRIQGWRILRVLESRPKEVPAFDDLDVQRRLELVAQRQLDDRRRSTALEDLLRSAYVWSPDLERAKAEREAAERAQAAEEAAEKAAEEAVEPEAEKPSEP